MVSPAMGQASPRRTLLPGVEVYARAGEMRLPAIIPILPYLRARALPAIILPAKLALFLPAPAAGELAGDDE